MHNKGFSISWPKLYLWLCGDICRERERKKNKKKSVKKKKSGFCFGVWWKEFKGGGGVVEIDILKNNGWWYSEVVQISLISIFCLKELEKTEHILNHLHTVSHTHLTYNSLLYNSAKTHHAPKSPPDSAKRIQPLCVHRSTKTRRQIQALPCLRHWTVQSTYYIICSECMHKSAWVHVQYVCVWCVFVVYACASMWTSGACVACSHARGPDCKCCTCMWWLIATRHNRTLNQTKRRLSSYTWEPLSSEWI